MTPFFFAFLRRLSALHVGVSHVLALAAVLALSACGDVDYRPSAIGPASQITVVMDPAGWEGPLGAAVRAELAPAIGTLPAPEPLFELRHVALRTQADLERVQAQKNVVIAAPLSDSTNAASVLRGALAPDTREAIESGRSVVASRSNLWRRDQQVFFLAADSAGRLVETVQNRGEALRDTFNLLARQRLYEEMFDRGRQPELEAQLMENHGFAVNAQHDYVVAADTSLTDSTGFVYLARVVSAQSWRRMMIWYKEDGDPATLTPQWIQATRDSLAQQWIQGSVGGFSRIDYRRPLEVEEVDFLGRYGYEMRGLWHLVDVQEDGSLYQYGGGGPFVTYAFYDQGQDRLYLIDGMVFAPDYDKREFLRQMEVIAYTFRTAAADSARQALAARSN